jgi:hypothetical protein
MAPRDCLLRSITTVQVSASWQKQRCYEKLKLGNRKKLIALSPVKKINKAQA